MVIISGRREKKNKTKIRTENIEMKTNRTIKNYQQNEEFSFEKDKQNFKTFDILIKVKIHKLWHRR